MPNKKLRDGQPVGMGVKGSLWVLISHRRRVVRLLSNLLRLQSLKAVT